MALEKEMVVGANERGTAMIETLISATLLMGVVIGLIVTGYLAFTKVWMRRASYEAAICLASQENKWTCRRHLMQAIDGVLPSGSLPPRLHLSRSQEEVSVEIAAKLTRFIWLEERRTLRLPLSASSIRLRGRRQAFVHAQAQEKVGVQAAALEWRPEWR